MAAPNSRIISCGRSQSLSVWFSCRITASRFSALATIGFLHQGQTAFERYAASENYNKQTLN